ncbi:fimbrial protein [Escherichia coli]|nr:fimbrial protein [Escherichia coli]
MKKTLIALAVAASAAVSGSAMAWTANGTGGSVDFGGTLTPQDVVTPWEVKVGAALNGLDADIQKGKNSVTIDVGGAMPLLGIRTVSTAAFQGQSGISPQISYGDAVNVDEFVKNKAPLTLKVTDDTNTEIGTLTSKLSASAIVSALSNNGGYNGYRHVYADTAGQGFFGGLPKNAEETLNADIASVVMPGVGEHFTKQNVPVDSVGVSPTFDDVNSTYSAFYASGIRSGEKIAITLNTPAQGDEQIVWKASLPVTVSYQ